MITLFSLLWFSCAGTVSNKSQIGMDLDEFKAKNKGENLYKVEGNLRIYGLPGNSKENTEYLFYYFKNGKLIAIDKKSNLPIESDNPFVYKPQKKENTDNIKLPGLEPIKAKIEPLINYNLAGFDYRYNESPISKINYKDLYDFYIKDSRDGIVGYYICEDLDIEIAIIKHIHKVAIGGKEEDFQYLLLVTKSNHQRFKYFEQFGRISHRTSDKVYSGEITRLSNKVKVTSAIGSYDTVLGKFGHQPVHYSSGDRLEKFIQLFDGLLVHAKTTFYFSNNQIKMNFVESEKQYSILFNKKNSKIKHVDNDFVFGTGFFLNANIIVTAYHVIEGKDNVLIVNSKNDTLKGEIISKDRFNDLVLIKTKSILDNNIPIPFIFNTKLKPKTGSSVYTIGYPFGDIMGNESRISEGIINSLFGLDDDPRLLQISNPIQPGNSGGILIDKSNGNLVGIVVSGLSPSYFLRELGTIPQNINFSVKSNYLKLLAESADINLDQINKDNLLEGKSLEDQFDTIKPFIVKILAN